MSDEVIKMTVPELSVPVPRVVVPSLKVTVPLGVLPEFFTVAVNFTDWPKADGFTLDVTIVVVSDLLTICISVVLLLGLEFESPA